MENWQKVEIISKVFAALFIPLAVAYLANQVATSNKQRDSETKFVELATAILSKEPTIDQKIENKSLRKWAVDVINRFSGVPMSEQTADALIKNTALPPITPVNGTSVVESDTWGVVFGGDTTLDAANFEVTKTAARMGINNGEVFRRAGSYRSVKVFTSRSEAEDALGKAQIFRPSSYIVNMSTWCPTSEPKVGYFECKSS
ncbi:hypothetical protein [Acinetobacter pittii]|uniref:hypothetical protein n=1 Tax=Acinetobacter pittii TaxID=48296 RepID=UPI000D345386|nr:hypothetical protein [Acinetobacter pittii]PTV50754.1 hypothetical protein DBL01_01060 [Acinetobacter pittii]